LRGALGRIAGAILVLSSGAHSLLGWKALNAELAAAQVPPQLVFGLKVGWHFGGVAMLAFGIIALALFAARLQGRRVSLFPALVTSVAYLGFGTWALIASHFNPFFFVFLVPAVLLVVAVGGDRGPSV
jgi:uncharacterized membrane protein YhaH (DUF805 family)